MGDLDGLRLLEQEARALLTRLARLQPYALQMPMVSAAGVSQHAQSAMEIHMSEGKQRLHGLVRKYLVWLQTPEGASSSPEIAQRRFTFLRLRFNAVLTQFDIFGDVMAQRSQHGTGVWTAGLDAVAADALSPLAPYLELPPVVCYLDRGVGAAIRRARTRLPGGDANPVAIIRVPRERMIGSGIASSLVHEVGHEAAAQLDLVAPLRQELARRQQSGPHHLAWRMWERWISEIVADFWSVGMLGITATTGLLAVVSLPRTFVFRVSLNDPHPAPWIRVKLSCAMGNALYPNSQWSELAEVWERMYPLSGLPAEQLKLFRMLEEHLDEFVEVLTRFHPAVLGGRAVTDILPVEERTPEKLRALYNAWNRTPGAIEKARPTLAFAVLGQARADGELHPEQESTRLAGLLTTWALSNSLETSAGCARQLLANTRRTPAPQLQQPFVLGEPYAIH
jgi:hypothetical protein